MACLAHVHRHLLCYFLLPYALLTPQACLDTKRSNNVSIMLSRFGKVQATDIAWERGFFFDSKRTREIKSYCTTSVHSMGIFSLLSPILSERQWNEDNIHYTQHFPIHTTTLLSTTHTKRVSSRHNTNTINTSSRIIACIAYIYQSFDLLGKTSLQSAPR